MILKSSNILNYSSLLYTSYFLFLYNFFFRFSIFILLFYFLLSQVERTIKCQLSGLQNFLYQNYRNAAQIQESRQKNHDKLDIDNNIYRADDGFYNENNSENYNNGSGSNSNNNGNDHSSMVGKLNYNNMLMQLRKLCNHPYLILEDIKSIPDKLYYEYIVKSCGKMTVLHGLLQELLPKGHKVSTKHVHIQSCACVLIILVFCFFLNFFNLFYCDISLIKSSRRLISIFFYFSYLFIIFLKYFFHLLSFTF